MNHLRLVVAVLAALALAVPASAAAHGEPVYGDLPTHGEAVAPAADRAPLRVAQPAGPAGADGLPMTWCGQPEGAAASDADGPIRFQLVYAYPSDEPNRFAQWADRMQADASLIGRFVAQQSGWRRTVRFALGTSCAPDRVSIAVVALPRPRDAYLDTSGRAVFRALVDSLRASPPNGAGSRNLVVFADTLGGSRPWGVGHHNDDQRPGQDNRSNRGGHVAAIYLPSALPADGAYQPGVVLHEMLHTIGAVNPDAPHWTGAGHCTDGADVMCYADGGPNNAMTLACSAFSFTLPERLDCGGDDYFNPAPVPGSYLADNWNTYNSALLGGCSELAALCGSNRGWVPPLVTDIMVAVPLPKPKPPTAAAPTTALVPPSAQVPAGASRPQEPTVLHASNPLRRTNRLGTQAGAILTWTRGDLLQARSVSRSLVSVRLSALKLPAGQYRIRDCVAAPPTRQWLDPHLRSNCQARTLRVARRGARRTRQVAEHRFTFTDGCPRYVAFWTDIIRVTGHGRAAHRTLWASSRKSGRPPVLISAR